MNLKCSMAYCQLNAYTIERGAALCEDCFAFSLEIAIDASDADWRAIMLRGDEVRTIAEAQRLIAAEAVAPD